jgi:hypothetical protein
MASSRARRVATLVSSDMATAWGKESVMVDEQCHG